MWMVGKREPWEDYYRRKVAAQAHVPVDAVHVIGRCDHVRLPLESGITDEFYVVELEYDHDGRRHTVYAWDDPPFRCVWKEGPVKNPSDAILAVLVLDPAHNKK